MIVIQFRGIKLQCHYNLSSRQFWGILRNDDNGKWGNNFFYKRKLEGEKQRIAIIVRYKGKIMSNVKLTIGFG